MQCKDIDDVRKNIDRIDKEIIKLTAERGNFVRQASNFKKIVLMLRHPKELKLLFKK